MGHPVRVLLTGFEAFGGDATNPTRLAVERLAARGPGAGGEDVDLRTAVLPVVFGAASEELLALVDAHEPDVVVATGLAGGRTAVTPERFAANLDERGGAGGSREQVADGPTAYASTLPVGALVADLRAAGVPATASSTAGHYVCNHVFYALMHHLAARGRPVLGGFVHVPCSHEQVLEEASPRPSLSLDTLVEALRVVVATSATAAARP